MSRKSTIEALFGLKGELLGAPNKTGATDTDPAPETNAAPRTAYQPVRTGAVAALGQSLQQWGEAARIGAELQVQLAQARSVVELDPSTVDPAPVRDRLPLENDSSFDSLLVSIREGGQQVPILVRPHPGSSGRYQAAYGHRRLAAAKKLGVKIKAIVTDLTDESLVLAQGKENSDRRDLSFVERALFARRLESNGQARAVIGTALSIDKADLSRIIAVAEAIPEALIQLIGPAPKAGRARWMTLAECLRDSVALHRAETVAASASFTDGDSDRRFTLVLAAAVAKASPTPRVAKPSRETLVRDAKDRGVVVLEASAKATRFTFDQRVAPEFATFVAKQIPDLYAHWRGLEAVSPVQPRRRPTKQMDGT